MESYSLRLHYIAKVTEYHFHDYGMLYKTLPKLTKAKMSLAGFEEVCCHVLKGPVEIAR
jgi:hypothetical protein